jgi:flagellar motor switch/type III secretory pathway protein FliN
MSSSSNSSSSNPVGTGSGNAAALVPLNDVVCRVDVLLGTATVSVGECLHWKRNSVIRLRQSAGGDMQVTINGVPVAVGEVVIIDDSTAIRLTEILPPPSPESES